MHREEMVGTVIMEAENIVSILYQCPVTLKSD